MTPTFPTTSPTVARTRPVSVHAWASTSGARDVSHVASRAPDAHSCKRTDAPPGDHRGRSPSHTVSGGASDHLQAGSCCLLQAIWPSEGVYGPVFGRFGWPGFRAEIRGV